MMLDMSKYESDLRKTTEVMLLALEAFWNYTLNSNAINSVGGI